VNNIYNDNGLDDSIINASRVSRSYRKEKRLGAPPKVDISILTSANQLPDGLIPNSMRGLLNFESKLEKDLAETTNSLINHMKSHNLLSSQKL
jgi:hypothetical protein